MQLIDGRPVYSATDLVGFLACSHRLALERAALAGLVNRPIRDDPEIELIAKRGLAHERRYLEELRAAGRSIVEIDHAVSFDSRADELRAAADATESAMRGGADVIYQATFFDGRWLGFADFLLRTETPSAVGPWSYEVADTKLARTAKAGAILQVCSYVEQLTRVQGTAPESLHIVLGGSAHETATHRVADFMAYYRRVKAEFEAAVTAGEPLYPVTATYPDPVEHCDVCKWVIHCKAQRRKDDDLSLVAGITARQRRALKGREVKHRRELAVLELPIEPRLEGVSGQALERVRDQARIQVAGEDAQEALHELLEPELDEHDNLVADRGFLVLPEPSANDLFFDIEGDPFALDDGVEYLFGVLEPRLVDPQRPGQPMFHEIWSRDPVAGDVTRAAEKAAFERLVDLLIARLDADPVMHIYHYATYEKTALARLAQRHATREEEVDRLLRGRVLVDLYRVVRQGIRASVESYSIKRLEGLYNLVREEDLKSAGSSIVAFEAWLDGGTAEGGEVGEAILRSIAGYNRDDVLSNWKLRDWLEARRVDLAKWLGRVIPRPPIEPDAETPKALTPAQVRVAELVGALTAGIPAERDDRTEEQHARWLLAQLLDWHRREEKAVWWRFFDLATKTDEELVDEREPLGRIEFIEDLGTFKQSVLQRFRFPIQDHGLKEGRAVVNPETVREHLSRACGTVHEIDEIGQTVVLKRSRENLEMGMPKALIPFDLYRTDELRDSLIRIAAWVLDHGVDAPGPYRSARDLLLRRGPRGGTDPRGPGEPLRRLAETPVDAAVRLGLALDHGTLAIQGPPGSGKTYTAAQMIVALVAVGRRVGVTANSHKVIGNALDAVHRAAEKAGLSVRIGQRHAGDEAPTSKVARPLGTNQAAREALDAREVDVVGGTAWLWSRADMEGSVEVLFVDEAGQFSLANAMAVAPAAESLVLLGDPQQLEQPLQGSHPPGAERSALGHVLDGAPVIPDEAGLFLTETWRLHPDVGAFTSEAFYERRLGFEPTLARQALQGVAPADGTGIRWLPVEHGGAPTESIDEALAITHLVRQLLGSGASWTDRHGETHPLRLDDIVIVAPYNAHVERIGKTLADAGFVTDRVGTVDKFQGQEAPISIYSMATPTAEEAPRGMEFLYSLNRLNVATSRARCAAIVVAAPALIRVQCHSPRQMQLANALCRLVEVAAEQAAAPAAGRTQPGTPVPVGISVGPEARDDRAETVEQLEVWT